MFNCFVLCNGSGNLASNERARKLKFNGNVVRASLLCVYLDIQMHTPAVKVIGGKIPPPLLSFAKIMLTSSRIANGITGHP